MLKPNAEYIGHKPVYAVPNIIIDIIPNIRDNKFGNIAKIRLASDTVPATEPIINLTFESFNPTVLFTTYNIPVGL